MSTARREVYPADTAALTEWHDANPGRFLISDGRTTFSVTHEEARDLGLTAMDEDDTHS